MRPIWALLLTACLPEPRSEHASDPGTPDAALALPVAPDGEPSLWISARALDFGAVPKDCSSPTRSIELVNQGEGPLPIEAVSVSGPGQSAFSLSALPERLAAGHRATAEISFTPYAWADYDVELQIEGEAVQLLGTGTAGVQWEDRFTQVAHERLDVLVVVDNTASMEPRIADVVASVQAHVEVLGEVGVDYRVGLVRNDARDDEPFGQLLGPWLTPDSPTSAIADQIDGARLGDSVERGLDAAQAALSEHSDGFLREEAPLRVIFFSDHNDEGTLKSSEFTSWLLAFDPDAAAIALCGDLNIGCRSEELGAFSAQAGNDYIDVAAGTGGEFVSICAADLEAQMAEAAMRSAGLASSLPLSAVPATLDDMVVSVGGVPLAQDVEDGWVYLPEANSIAFRGATPDFGETITVSFLAATSCD